MTFTRSLAAQGAAMVILNTARDGGYWKDGDPLNVSPELAEAEHELFVKMLERLDARLRSEKETQLTHDEISSLFTFVFARAAEAVTNFQCSRKNDFDYLGMFDGKVPIYAHERLTGYFKELKFPADCAVNFLNWSASPEAAEAVSAVDPKLLLFEALKWTFRFSCHIALESL